MPGPGKFRPAPAQLLSVPYVLKIRRTVPGGNRLPAMDIGCTRLGFGRAGRSAGRRAGGYEFGALPVSGDAPGGAVEDQAGDGQVDLAAVLASSGVPLEGPPLPMLGVSILDADPAGILYVLCNDIA
jgi:hypothetical protein